MIINLSREHKKKLLVYFIAIAASSGLVLLSKHLIEDRNITANYAELERLLQQKKWMESDQETSKIIGNVIAQQVDNHFLMEPLE